MVLIKIVSGKTQSKQPTSMAAREDGVHHQLQEHSQQPETPESQLPTEPKGERSLHRHQTNHEIPIHGRPENIWETYKG